MTSDTLLQQLLPADFDREGFLRDYWQQKPLLIRGRPFADPVSPEALAGMACESVIDARLVQYQADPEQWRLQHGPFEEALFASLPPDNYSLLVQSVDSWLPGVRQLARNFSFIPGWRRDDIMVSYATPGGNVGPHFDQYDVFLIQGLGRKRWLLGGHCDDQTAVDDSSGLRLLPEFRTQQSYVVESGDILYLPPGIAHHGIAETPAITYSVGFRAPSMREVVAELAPWLARQLPESRRYQDAATNQPSSDGAIPAAAAEVLAGLFRTGSEQALTRQDLILRWFGEYMTAPRHAELLEDQADLNTEQSLDSLLQHGTLVRNPLSRFAWCDSEAGPLLFADGQSLQCATASRPLLQQLCDEHRDITETVASRVAADQALLRDLFAQGSLMAREDLPEAFVCAAD